MFDEPELSETSWTETVVRQFDTEGQLVAETVTVVTSHRKPDDELPVGMYL